MQILAILRRRTDTFSDDDFAPLLEPEAEAVRKLYAQGVVRAVWSREDTPGAAMLIEADSIDAARAVTATFPLAQKGMLELEMLIPLKGYRGFGPRS